jgi:hypothetical protein
MNHAAQAKQENQPNGTTKVHLSGSRNRRAAELSASFLKKPAATKYTGPPYVFSKYSVWTDMVKQFSPRKKDPIATRRHVLLCPGARIAIPPDSHLRSYSSISSASS